MGILRGTLQNLFASRGGQTGLDVGAHGPRTSARCREILHLYFFQTSGLVTFEAAGPLGTIVARLTLTGPGAGHPMMLLFGAYQQAFNLNAASPLSIPREQ